jgi:phosphoribosylglycinamide formyltransferase 2
VTDGLTEGQRGPIGDERQPAAAEGDKTTVIAVPPRVPDVRTGVGPRVMLLGSGEVSRELAIALQRLGAAVIAVDRYPDAPAHAVADQQLVLSMTDGNELSQAIRRVQPDVVVTNTDAVATDALDALDAPAAGPQLVPGARAVRLTADRESLRRLAADELGLPTAPFWFVGSVDELASLGAHAGFPLLVKPTAPTVGRGQSIVAGPDDVGPAWQRAGSNRVLAEMVVEVEFLVTLLTVRTEGADGLVIDFCSPIGHRGADADVPESWQPQQLTPAAMDSARSIAARIVTALGGRGVFGVELMVNGDEVYFADVTARPRGSAWVTACSQRLSVFDLQARAVLGLPVDTLMVSPGAARAVLRGPDDGPPAARALGGALRVAESDVRLFGQGGRQARKLGVALATAPGVSAARDRVRQVATALTMRDSPG